MRLSSSYRSLGWLLPALCVLAGCQKTPQPFTGTKVGKPYVVAGHTYFPEYDPTYDKIGKASWYGPGFHGHYTASGEIYNQNDLTAAHPTLPMPSMVRVTNLSNGRSLIVRVNDRGPFKSNRIIDLSKKAAESLGISSTADVRVQFLKKETDEYIASVTGATGGKQAEMLAINSEAAQNRDASIIQSTEPTGQIVESTVASTHAGQTVDEAAPYMTVSSQDLNSQGKVSKEVKLIEPVAAPAEVPAPPAETTVKAVWADDHIAPLTQVPSNDAALAPASIDLIPPPGTKAPVALTPATSKSAFYIQAGSFSTEENARKLSAKLSSIGASDAAEVTMNGKSWWRVRVGPFQNQQDADNALDQVRANHLPDARIIHQ